MNTTTLEVQAKPEEYEDCLSDYRACIFDGWCGEPIGWGFKLTRRIGEDRFNALRKFGSLECIYPEWYLIVKSLTRQKAIEKYGEITNEELGPKGGFKSITFGDKKFISRWLK